MTSYEAIYNRCSVRKFKMELIPSEFFRQLNKFLGRLTPLYPDIDWRFVLFNAMDHEGSTKGMFKVKAPYYLVCYTGEGEKARIQAGYLTEQVVLYLTAHGFGTCYQGAAKAEVDDEPEKMLQRIVVAFGYADERLYRESGSARRLPVEEICTFKESVSEEEMMLLEASRLAPSSMNSQPWRFVVYKNRIHLFARENVLTRANVTRNLRDIDLGIVLYHLALAAEELWLDGYFVYNQQLAERSVKNNMYVMSFLLKN